MAKLDDTKQAVHAKLIGVPYGSFAHSYLVIEYLVGEGPPNFPCPSIIGYVDIDLDCVVIGGVAQSEEEECAASIKYWLGPNWWAGDN